MLSTWKALNKDKSLPLEGTASQFQYRHFINWEVPLISLGIAGRKGEGQWHIQLITPDGTVIFEQTVTLTVLLVSLGSFGLQLFTWFFFSEKIETTSIGGAPTDPDTNPSWRYTIGGTEFSEFGTMEKGGGSDYTDVIAYITDWWDSPVYKLTIPLGTKLKVVRDSWGLGVASRPEWQWRFRKGAFRLVDNKFGPFGEVSVASAKPGSTLMRTGHHWNPYNQQPREWTLGTISGCTDPSVMILEDGRRLLGVLQKDGYWEYESLDMERSWRKMRYPAANGVDLEEKPLAGPEVTMPQMVTTRNGIRLLFYVRGNLLQIRRLDDSGPGDVITVGTAVGEESYSLDLTEDGVVAVFATDGRTVWTSKTEGTYFQQSQFAADGGSDQD